MKNMTQRTLAIAVLGLLWAAGGAPEARAQDLAAVDGPWRFTATPGANLLYGVAHEYVYDGSNTLSELDWDLKPVATLSSGLRARLRGLELGLDCSVGFPDSAGYMIDRDWGNESGGDTSTVTNYSQHSAYAQSLVAAELSAAMLFEPGPRVELRALLGFRWLDIAWTARDGWYQYASNIKTATSPNYYSYTTGTAQSMYGLICTYEQRYFILFAGIGIDWRLSDRLSLSATVRASPAVWAIAIDNHVERGFTATDWMSGGYLLEPQASLSWRPSRRMTLGLAVGYSVIGGLRGYEVIIAGDNVDSDLGLSPGESRTYDGVAGAGMDALELGMTATFGL